MNYYMFDEIFGYLRKHIYECVPSYEIDLFIYQDNELAKMICRADVGGSVEIRNAWNIKVRRFLEMIDGDSDFNIQWKQGFMEGEIACRIQLKSDI